MPTVVNRNSGFFMLLIYGWLDAKRRGFYENALNASMTNGRIHQQCFYLLCSFVVGTVYGLSRGRRSLKFPVDAQRTTVKSCVYVNCIRKIQFISVEMFLLVWLVFGSFTADFVVTVSITVHTRVKEYRPMPRFWTNVGFSPPAPLPLNNTQVTGELLGDDVRISNELIAALPNQGIEHIRIHWLLSLIKFEWVKEKHLNFALIPICY